MNKEQQWQLLRAARRVPGVTPPDHFCADVLRAIRQDVRRTAASASLADQLVALLPRLAATALVIIAAVMAFEFFVDGDFMLHLAEATDQWLLPANWL
jgi:predicted nucleic acid-binding protein